MYQEDTEMTTWAQRGFKQITEWNQENHIKRDKGKKESCTRCERGT
jgi:hypothetical protein